MSKEPKVARATLLLMLGVILLSASAPSAQDLSWILLRFWCWNQRSQGNAIVAAVQVFNLVPKLGQIQDFINQLQDMIL